MWDGGNGLVWLEIGLVDGWVEGQTGERNLTHLQTHRHVFPFPAVLLPLTRISQSPHVRRLGIRPSLRGNGFV